MSFQDLTLFFTGIKIIPVKVILLTVIGNCQTKNRPLVFKREVEKIKETFSAVGIKKNLCEWNIKKEEFQQLIKGVRREV